MSEAKTLCIESDELMRIRDRDYRMGAASVASQVRHWLLQLTDPERIDGCELLVQLSDGSTVPALQHWETAQLDIKLRKLNSFSYVETGEYNPKEV